MNYYTFNAPCADPTFTWGTINYPRKNSTKTTGVVIENKRGMSEIRLVPQRWKDLATE